MKSAKILRILPAGSTLTGERGRVYAIGDRVTEGASLTLATPNGEGGCLNLSAMIPHTVRSVRLAPIVIEPEAAAPTPRVTTIDLGDGGPNALHIDV